MIRWIQSPFPMTGAEMGTVRCQQAVRPQPDAGAVVLWCATAPSKRRFPGRETFELSLRGQGTRPLSGVGKGLGCHGTRRGWGASHAAIGRGFGGCVRLYSPWRGGPRREARDDRWRDCERSDVGVVSGAVTHLPRVFASPRVGVAAGYRYKVAKGDPLVVEVAEAGTRRDPGRPQSLDRQFVGRVRGQIRAI